MAQLPIQVSQRHLRIRDNTMSQLEAKDEQHCRNIFSHCQHHWHTLSAEGRRVPSKYCSLQIRRRPRKETKFVIFGTPDLCVHKSEWCAIEIVKSFKGSAVDDAACWAKLLQFVRSTGSQTHPRLWQGLLTRTQSYKCRTECHCCPGHMIHSVAAREMHSCWSPQTYVQKNAPGPKNTMGYFGG